MNYAASVNNSSAASIEPTAGTWMTSRLKKRPAQQYHVTGVVMTTASGEQVVARVGKSPSDFYDSVQSHYYYDADYDYERCPYH